MVLKKAAMRRYLRSGAASALLSGLAGPALAQSADPSVELEEVVVTAERRDTFDAFTARHGLTLEHERGKCRLRKP